VDALVANTFVYRRTDPLDRRRVLVYLNPLRSRDLDAVEASAWTALTDAVADLTEAGRERLAELVARAATNGSS
jgi:DNA-binding MarR family transcriptional regulator